MREGLDFSLIKARFQALAGSTTAPFPLGGPDPRTGGHNQLGASNDLEAIRQFVSEYQASESTARAYAKEVERFLLWALLERGKSLAQLSREDFAAYAAFLSDPQPCSRWCGPKRGRLGQRFSPGWRPFVGPLSPTAQHTALAILNTLMQYLVRSGYLFANPLALMPRRGASLLRRSGNRQIRERMFDALQWQAILTTLEEGCCQPGRAFHYERLRFLVALLHFLALRIGEVATHCMGSFTKVGKVWIFVVVGKGNKEAELPVNAPLLYALQRYRAILNLPPLPQRSDPLPLLGAHNAPHQPLTARQLSFLIKGLVKEAAARLAVQAPERAEHLTYASPHWFRHHAITKQARAGIPILHIRENARHTRLDTTLLYVHTEQEARAQTMEQLNWQNDEEPPPGA